MPFEIKKRGDRCHIPAFLRYVRTLGCCICGKPSTASHMTSIKWADGSDALAVNACMPEQGIKARILSLISLMAKKLPMKVCETCGDQFQPSRSKSRFCSKGCSNRSALKWPEEHVRCSGFWRIRISNDLFATVCDCHYGAIKIHRWSYSKRGYAVANIDRRSTPMHYLVLPEAPGMERDHINRDKLDNRCSNLRYATHAQNAVNAIRRNRHGFRGIKVCGRKKEKFRASLLVAGTYKNGPTRITPSDAARDYDILARQYQGEFAHTNFPE